MAMGFKVADAYVSVHADDDTHDGRRRIERNTTSWAKRLGFNLGGMIGKSLVAGIVGAFGALFKAALMVGKLSLLALAVGTVATAIAGLLGAIVNLLPYVADLASAAVTAAGALLLIPGAITTLISVVATLKIGLNGISDALKAGLTGDVEKLNEALAKLAPNAQDFVREIIRLKPAWDRMRLPIQNALFAELAGLIRRVAEVYLPVMEAGLTRVANVLNGAFRQAMLFLLSPGASSDIAAILASAALAAGNFGDALGPVLQILRDVAVVSTAVFADLSGGLLPMIRGWADIISQMRADGSLAQLILDGVEALKQFAGLAGDILGILKGIFGAAGGAEGGGIFGFFDRLNTLINSVAGQEALTQLFTALGDVAVSLTPVLLVLAQALVPIAQGLAVVAEAFAPGLMVLVEGLSQGLVALVPGLVALTPVFETIAMFLPTIGQGISDLLVAFSPHLVDGLQGLGSALGILAKFGGPLGESLGMLLTAIEPFLPVLAGMLVDLIINLAPGATALITALGQAMVSLAPSLPGLAQSISQLVIALSPLVAALGPVLAELLPVITEEFILLAEMIAPVAPLFASLMVELAPFLAIILKIGIWLAILPLKIAELGAMILTWLTENGAVGAAKRGIESFGNAVQSKIGLAVDFFRNLGTTIKNALGNFGTLLYDAGRNVVQGLINGITSMISGLRNKASEVASTIRNFFPFSPAKTGPLSGRGDLRYAGRNMVAGLVRGIEDEYNSARMAAEALASLFRPGGGDGARILAGSGLAFGGAGVSAGSPPLYVMVQIGERPVRDMVEATVKSHPTLVSDATNEGNRRQAFSGRKRIGDT